MYSYWKNNQLKIATRIFLAPGIFMFSLYVIFPIFQSISLSFYQWNGLGTKTYIGVENYIELMDDEYFFVSLKNNVIWLVLYLLAVPAGLFAALFLNQTVRGIRIYKSIFFFPFVISQVVVGLVFSWFYDPSNGLLNIILELLGFDNLASGAEEHYVTYCILVACLWPQTADCMIRY